MPVTLYVDVDGCLHPSEVYLVPGQVPELRGPGSLFMHAPALAAAVAPFDLAIILSTSWVHAVGLAAVTERLPQALANRVAGSTHDGVRAVQWSQLSRFAQISAHVRAHNVLRWLALDDDTWGWPAHERHRLISPQPAVGLAQPDLELLVRRLGALADE
jgi:hypothetical protein